MTWLLKRVQSGGQHRHLHQQPPLEFQRGLLGQTRDLQSRPIHPGRQHLQKAQAFSAIFDGQETVHGLQNGGVRDLVPAGLHPGQVRGQVSRGHEGAAGRSTRSRAKTFLFHRQKNWTDPHRVPKSEPGLADSRQKTRRHYFFSHFLLLNI